jgi:hypothetical protein
MYGGIDVLLVSAGIVWCVGALWRMREGSGAGCIRMLLVPILFVLVLALLPAMAQYRTGDFTQQDAVEHGRRMYGK